MSIICNIDLFVMYQAIYLQYPDGRVVLLDHIELEDVPERLIDLTHAYPNYNNIILSGIEPIINSIKNEIQTIEPTAKVLTV